jgi:hypothetical protein
LDGGGLGIKTGPVRIFVSIERHLALFAVKGTVPFLLTQKLGQSLKTPFFMEKTLKPCTIKREKLSLDKGYYYGAKGDSAIFAETKIGTVPGWRLRLYVFTVAAKAFSARSLPARRH